MQSDRTVQFWNTFYLNFENQRQQRHHEQKQQHENQQEHQSKSQQLAVNVEHVGVVGNHTDKHTNNNETVATAAKALVSCCVAGNDGANQMQLVAKEWILKPSPDLFDLILTNSCFRTLAYSPVKEVYKDDYSSIHQDNTVVKDVYRILEIGCGNSFLAVEFWKYILNVQQQASTRNADNNDADDDKVNDSNQALNQIERTQLSRKRIQFWATDVSDICIQQIRHRDSDIVKEYEQPNTGSSMFDMNSDDQFFRYCVLNVTQPHPELENKFDLILDKGCLDTFLFRSKNRGANGKQYYAELIQTVLDNIQSWLRNDDHSNPTVPKNVDNAIYDTTEVQTNPTSSMLACRMSRVTDTADTKGEVRKPKDSPGGVYLILSPRSKHKSVRDYCGFRTVDRKELDTSHLCVGSLEVPRAINNSTNFRKKTKHPNKIVKEGIGLVPIFLYICSKNDNYYSIKGICGLESSEDSDQNTDKHLLLPATPTLPTLPAFLISNYENFPDDNDMCPSCKISFFIHRNGESIAGKGKAYWYRHWKGHCLHCKEVPLNST